MIMSLLCYESIESIWCIFYIWYNVLYILFQTYSTAELENKLCDLEYKLSVKGK
jgi:hypothetical protein